MSSLERAVVRHIMRNAYHQRVDQHGHNSASMQALREAAFFISDLHSEELRTLLLHDMREYAAELDEQ